MIVIEGAVNTELDALEARLGPVREVALGGGWHARICSAAEYGVALVNTGVGVANAAAATALACAQLNPRALISQGTAGAHDIALHSGDLVIGRRIVRLGAYKSASAAQGVHPLSWQPLSPSGSAGGAVELASDERMLELALQAVAERGFNVPGAPRAIPGTVGSGDVWNCERDMIEYLNRTFGTACEEMETYAAAQVCARFGVRFLSVRAISNNERLGETYDPATARAAQLISGDVALKLMSAASR